MPRGNSLETMYPANASQVGFLLDNVEAIDSFSLLAAAHPFSSRSKTAVSPVATSLQTQSRPTTGHDTTPTKIPEGNPTIETG